MKHGVRAVILAGGLGERLQPLTGLDPFRDRPKPNVPFEKRRLIDLVISNCLHSKVDDTQVLVQAHPNKVIGHIQATYLTHEVGGTVRGQVVPMVRGEERFAGTFDAVRKSPHLLNDDHRDFLIPSGDHLYRMIYDDLIEFHRQQAASITVVVKRLPAEVVGELGVFAVNTKNEPTEFVEKPGIKGIDPPVIPGTNQSLASLGIYMISAKALEKLFDDCQGDDFGNDVIPLALSRNDYKVALFEYNGYWRDVGTIGSLWQANMDIIGPVPALNLYDLEHPIYHRPRHFASPKFINGCKLQDAIISDGCIVAGEVYSSVLSTRVRIGSDTQLNECVIFDKTKIGRGAKLRRVISDKLVQIGDGVVLGANPEAEAKNFPDQIVLKDGILVIKRGAIIGEPPKF